MIVCNTFTSAGAKQNKTFKWYKILETSGNVHQNTFTQTCPLQGMTAVGQMSHDNVFISGVEKLLRMALFIPGKGQVVTTTKRIGHWGSWLLILRVILCLLDDKNANEVQNSERMIFVWRNLPRPVFGN